jgi:hypothetical protein
MKIKYLLFSSLLILSNFLNLAHAKYNVTKSTTQYFSEEAVGSCTGHNSNLDSFSEFYSCFVYEALTGLLNSSSSCLKNAKEILKDLGCKDEFITGFTSRFTKDNIEAHKKQLEKIKKEFDSFKVEGLTASSKVSKYLNYIKDFDIEGLVEVDPEIQKEIKINKTMFMARKQTCSDVMNLKEPLSLNRPRNQDSVGWCYAYTASDLLSNALGKNVSAVQLSGLYNDKFISKVFTSGEGGYVVSTLEEAQKYGVCLESDLPSEDYEFSQLGINLEMLFKKTRELGKNYSKRIVTTTRGKDSQTTSKPMFTKAQVMADICLNSQVAVSSLQQLFPRLTLEQISEILLKSGVNAFTEMTKSCQREKDSILSSLEIKREWRSSQLYKTIDEQLSKGNILGISYNFDMLEDSKKGGFFMNHASSIVGRRFNDKTMSCEYLLRNSWGTSCNGYSEDYECSNGHVWINEESFKHKNSIFEVEYVEKK